MYNTVHTHCVPTQSHIHTHAHSFGSGPNKMAAAGHIGDDGFLLYAEVARCSRSAFISPDQGQAKVLPASQTSENTQPCLLRENHNTYTHDWMTPYKLLSTSYGCRFFFPLQIIYNCDSFKHICQIFIPDLGQCTCGGALIDLNACFCSTVCCILGLS